MTQLVTILVIVAVIFGGWLWLNHEKAVAPGGSAGLGATSTLTGTSTSPTSSQPAAANKDGGGAHPTLTYGEAVATFSTRRIQFDANCVAIPSSIVLKNGTNVMFDNRSPESRSFALDGTRYSLRGYDFRILTLRASTLPHTIVVDCGNGRNNGQIILN